MDRVRGLLFVGVLGALALAPAAAWAEPTAAEIAEAKKLFKEATAHEAEQEWAEAERKLRAAIAIKETPGLRYHLAYSQEQQGKLLEADADYARAEEMIRNGTKQPDVEKLLGPARDALRERMPTVTVKLPKDVDEVTIDIDSKVVDKDVATQPMPVNPGAHQVTVRAPGRQPYVANLRLGERERRTVNVVLPVEAAAPAGGPVDDTPPPADSGVSTDSSGWSTKTWVMIGEGAFTAIALGAGIVFTLQQNKADDEAAEADASVAKISKDIGVDPKSACKDPKDVALKDSCDQFRDLLDERDRNANFALASFIGAGVGAAATVATFFLWPDEKADAARRPRVIATPTPGGAYLGLGASF